MRLIWFRGKRLFSYGYNDAWIEGGFHQRDGKSDIIGISKNYRIDGCEVDPETVGQYTGLTDKNGTRIFEGDIVAGAVHWLERYKNGVVAFRDGSFGLIWHRGDIEQFNAFTGMCNVEYEVIGNIHDNPELLEGREKT